MKVLHLYSDWKWTGPAEPCLGMVQALRQRGVDARLAVPALPFKAVDTLESKAKSAGVPLVEGMALTKHFHPLKTFLAARHVREYCQRERIDIVHTHRRQDHVVGSLALPVSRTPSPALIRSSHEGIPLESDWRHRLAQRRTSLYLPVSRAAGAVDAQAFRLPDERWAVLPPALDTHLFHPEVGNKDLRQKLGIPTGSLVVGIVARMQRHRRFQELLEAWALVAREEPGVHFTIIGRGTHMEEVAVEPSRKLGLERRLTFAGYHRETFVEAVSLIDIAMFMVPGSDGSCRALRQCLAMGRPAVTSRRGMIPEIVRDGVTGLCVDDTPQNLSAAILRLVRDRALRERMGAEARRVAVEEGSLEVQATLLEAHYTKLLAAPRQASC